MPTGLAISGTDHPPALGSCHGLLPAHHPLPPQGDPSPSPRLGAQGSPWLCLQTTCLPPGLHLCCPPPLPPPPATPHSAELKTCPLQKASLDRSSQSALEGCQVKCRLPCHI